MKGVSAPRSTVPAAVTAPLLLIPEAEMTPSAPIELAVIEPAVTAPVLIAVEVRALLLLIPAAVRLPLVRRLDPVMSAAVNGPLELIPALEITPLVETPLAPTT